MWHPFDLWHSWRKMANGTSEKSSLWRPERIRKLCNSLKWQTKKSYDVQTHTNHAAFLSQDIPVYWCTVYSRIHVNCNRCYDSSWFQVKLQGPQGLIHGMREWGSSLFTPFDNNCFPKLWLFLSSPRIPFSWLQLEVYPDEEVCISICCRLVAWREQSTLHWQILCLYLATNAPFPHSLIPRCCTLAPGSQQVDLLVAALSLASKCARGPDPKIQNAELSHTPSSHVFTRFLNIESRWIQPPKSTWKIPWKHVFSLHHKISICI